MSYKGQFKPIHKEKYKGNPDKIRYLSLWELRLMQYFDNPRSKHIIKWSSEEVIIPYYSRADGRERRYYMDFWVKMKLPDGTIREQLIEVKPKKETIPPVPPKKPNHKNTASYKRALYTWQVNQDKWAAAEKLAKSMTKRNAIFEDTSKNIRCDFIKMTEEQLDTGNEPARIRKAKNKASRVTTGRTINRTKVFS